MSRYVYAALAVIAVLIAAAGISELAAKRKFQKLTEENRRLSAAAAGKTAEAETLRREAERLTALNEYLNRRIAELRNTAQKQDELIKNLDIRIDSARNSINRTRSIRAISANAAELCRKLAELGHACGESEDGN